MAVWLEKSQENGPSRSWEPRSGISLACWKRENHSEVARRLAAEIGERTFDHAIPSTFVRLFRLVL
jgi:hypothetical protein